MSGMCILLHIERLSERYRLTEIKVFICPQAGEPVVDTRPEPAAGAALHPPGRLHGQGLLEGGREGGEADAQQTPSRDAGGGESMRGRQSPPLTSHEEATVTSHDVATISQTTQARKLGSRSTYSHNSKEG